MSWTVNKHINQSINEWNQCFLQQNHLILILNSTIELTHHNRLKKIKVLKVFKFLKCCGRKIRFLWDFSDAYKTLLGGWMDGWSKSHFKNCLQQSKNMYSLHQRDLVCHFNWTHFVGKHNVWFYLVYEINITYTRNRWAFCTLLTNI